MEHALIRPAGLEDANLILRIRKESILAQPETFWKREQLLRAANHYDGVNLADGFSGHKFYLYDNSAFIGLQANYLATLFVLPEHQGKGLGSYLLEFAESMVRKEHDNIWLFAHPYAEKFYKHHGYERQNESEAPFGTPLYKYLKRF